MKALCLKRAEMALAVVFLAFAAGAGDVVYVKAKGSNVEPYDSEATAATSFKTAIEYAKANSIGKVKVVGTVQETAGSNLDLSGLEVYSDGWSSATLKGGTGGSQPRLSLGAGAFLHDLKLDTWRVTSGLSLTADTACVSNCWINNLYYSTAGSPALNLSAGLVTHCLFTACYCNYGPVLSIGGTGVMRNTIVKDCFINAGTAQDRTGVVNASGSAVVENCVIYGNHAKKTANAEAHTAGVRVSSGSPVIRNNVVRNNWINGTVGADGATEHNYLCTAGATPSVYNNNSTEGCGENATTADPGFTNAANNDFSVTSAGSCLVDAGAYQPWQMTATDYAGNARYQGAFVDVGVREFAAANPSIALTADKTTVTGAQTITFTAENVNAAQYEIPAGAEYVWKIDGEVVEGESAATMAKLLDVGTYSVSVELADSPYGDAHENWITVNQAAGVDFTPTATQYAGFAKVSFASEAVGGATFDAGATYKWYRAATDGAVAAQDDWVQFATGATVADARFEPGTWRIKVVVENCDGAGASVEKEHVTADVEVDAASVAITVSGTEGEAKVTSTLTATATGFTFDGAAEYKWYWTAGDGAPALPETADATGNPAEHRFGPGCWTIVLKVENADGLGTSFAVTNANAVTVTRGADFYLSSTGNDANAGDTPNAAFKTLAAAVAAVNASGIEGVKKIKVSGQVPWDSNATLNDVELYGENRETDMLYGDSNAARYLDLQGNTFVHDLKICRSRVSGGAVRIGATETGVVISNCWITANWFTTGGTAGGVYNAGLVTHTLFSENFSNNSDGTAMWFGGTVKVRNCVFRQNRCASNLRGALNGYLGMSGTAEMENCVVEGGWCAASAAGDAYSVNCRPRRGGGIYISSGSPVIRNSIIRNNKVAPEPSDGLYPTESGEDIYSATVEKDFYIAAGATPVIENCNVPEGQIPEGAVNCQTGDPLFTDAANGDYTIGAGSPVINAGRFQTWQRTATDYTGATPRFQGSAVDIGAYEFAEPTPVIDITASPDHGFDEVTVTFTAANVTDGASLSPSATAVWTINGVEQDETALSFQKTLGVGSYDVGVVVNDAFTCEKTALVVIRHTPGVQFETTVESAKANRKYASFVAEPVGDVAFGAGTTYSWLRKTGAGEWTEFSTVANPQNVEFGTGTWDVKVVVSGYDGVSAPVERVHESEITVETAGIVILISSTRATGEKGVVFTVQAENFDFAPGATFAWTIGDENATGNPVVKTLGVGSYDVAVTVTNADGAGAELGDSIEDAVVIEAQGAMVVPQADPRHVKKMTTDHIAAFQGGFRTVNGQSIFGTGDIEIAAEDDYVPYEDVDEYGAAGDGVSDDTAAFTAAIAAARTSGKPVRVGGKGDYRVTGTLTLEGVSIDADLGAKVTSTADPAIVVTGAGVRIENLQLGTAANATGVAIANASGALMKRLVITQASGGTAFSVADSTGTKFIDSMIKNGAVGFAIGANASGVNVMGNIVKSPTTAAVQVNTASADLIVDGNEFDGGVRGVSGIACGIITHNEIKATGYGIYLDGGGGLILSGNQFAEMTGAAKPVYVANATGLRIIGNNGNNQMTSTTESKLTAGYMTLEAVSGVELRANTIWQRALDGENIDIVIRNSENVAVTANVLVGGRIDTATGNTNVVKTGNYETEEL